MSIKSLVSKKKRRYIKYGYDLDLTYITKNVIAMGFPSVNYEKLYRNNYEEVYKFLNERHANHYKVYNLCRERTYDDTKFDGNVEHYPFDDHNAPPFDLLFKFCESVDKFLNESSSNVVAVHCKAGKGRTGVMICCYLMYSLVSSSPCDALTLYDHQRTSNAKGVTIPSQRRYIHFFYMFCKTFGKRVIDLTSNYKPLPIQLSFIIFQNIFEKSKIKKILVEIQCLDDPHPLVFHPTEYFNNHCVCNTLNYPTIVGDFKLTVYDITVPKKTVIMTFWNNTFFMKTETFRNFVPIKVCEEYCVPYMGLKPDLKEDIKFSNLQFDNLTYTSFSRNLIDGPHKDHNEKQYGLNFTITLGYTTNNNIFKEADGKGREDMKDSFISCLDSNFIIGQIAMGKVMFPSVLDENDSHLQPDETISPSFIPRSKVVTSRNTHRESCQGRVSKLQHSP